MRIRGVLVTLVLMTAHAYGDDVDAEKWLKAHGVMGEIDPVSSVSGCSEVVVGKAREHALSCTEIEEIAIPSGGDIPIGLVITHATINVVRGGKVVVVLDAPTRLQSFDAMPGQRPRMQLKMRLAADGLSARVDAVDSDVCRAKPDNDAERRICNARGAYVWRNGRFAKLPKPIARRGV